VFKTVLVGNNASDNDGNAASNIEICETAWSLDRLLHDAPSFNAGRRWTLSRLPTGQHRLELDQGRTAFRSYALDKGLAECQILNRVIRRSAAPSSRANRRENVAKRRDDAKNNARITRAGEARNS
jgi:hypothetical protein